MCVISHTHRFKVMAVCRTVINTQPLTFLFVFFFLDLRSFLHQRAVNYLLPPSGDEKFMASSLLRAVNAAITPTSKFFFNISLRRTPRRWSAINKCGSRGVAAPAQASNTSPRSAEQENMLSSCGGKEVGQIWRVRSELMSFFFFFVKYVL